MAGRNPRMIQRRRADLELSVLHVEIRKDNHEFLREAAKAKQMPVAGYLDVLIDRRKAKLKKLGFIQSEDSPLNL